MTWYKKWFDCKPFFSVLFIVTLTLTGLIENATISCVLMKVSPHNLNPKLNCWPETTFQFQLEWLFLSPTDPNAIQWKYMV